VGDKDFSVKPSIAAAPSPLRRGSMSRPSPSAFSFCNWRKHSSSLFRATPRRRPTRARPLPSRQGDYIVANNDGVVFVPGARIVRSFAVALTLRDAELNIVKSMLSSASTTDVIELKEGKFMKAVVISASIALFAVLASPKASEAHHAINAQFNVEEEFTKTGVLVKFEGINPHPYWHFDVQAPDGSIESWRFESGSLALLRRAGVRVREDINVGETYELHYNTARNGSNVGFLRGITIRGERLRLSNS